MNILVTGCAGFIGGHVSEKLLAMGHNVVGIDNLNDFYSPKIKEHRIELLSKFLNFKFFKGDILNEKLIAEIFAQEKIDRVCHLAARAGVRPSIEQPLLYEEVNIKGTLILLEACKKFKVNHFVFASSSSVYGNNSKVPFSETDNVDNPISPYAATKKACELMAHTYSHLYDIACVGLRFFTVYGPFGRPDMAPFIFMKNIAEATAITKFGDGNTKRDYTYIDDIVDGTINATLKDFASKYEIFNLGNNRAVSLNDFIATIEKVVEKKAVIKESPPFAGDVGITYADIEKAQLILEYNPQTDIEEGLKKFYKWFLDNQNIYS